MDKPQHAVGFMYSSTQPTWESESMSSQSSCSLVGEFRFQNRSMLSFFIPATVVLWNPFSDDVFSTGNEGSF